MPQEDVKKWYGEVPTIEEALKATASLREEFKSKKSEYFTVKKGQILRCLYHYADLKPNEICVSLVDSKNHALFLHLEESKRYMQYIGKSTNFKPANDEEIRAFFNVEAVIEQEANNQKASESGEDNADGNADGQELDNGSASESTEPKPVGEDNEHVEGFDPENSEKPSSLEE